MELAAVGRDGRRLAWASLAAGTGALVCIGIPVISEDESSAFLLYKMGAVLGGMTAPLAIAALGLGRLRRWHALGLCAAILFGAYALLYAVVAHQERERNLRLLACAVRLSALHSEVQCYIIDHGQYPTRLADLESPLIDAFRCPEGGEYVLWPEEAPAGPAVLPLPHNHVVAREAEPGHLSPWWQPLFPLPFLLDEGGQSFCETYPEIANALVLDRKVIEEYRQTFLGLKCTGPLHVSGEGAIRIPGSAYLSIPGLRRRARERRPLPPLLLPA